MKNRMFVGLVAAATALVLTSSIAAAQEAYSANAIGVIKKTLPAGKRVLLSVPLDQESDSGEGFTFASVPGIANLPNGTVVYFWDVTTQKWVGQAKGRGSWGDVADRLVTPGEAFFLENNEATPIELVISGEVPPDPSMSKGLAGGARTLISNPYPVNYLLSDFAFASALPNGSVVYFWDVANQKWIGQAKGRGNWGDEENRPIAAGEGFFIEPDTSAATWTETRPYTWPNN